MRLSSASSLCLVLMLVVGWTAPSQAALTVNGYSAARHDRFANSPSFIGAAYDWSGVGQTAGGAWGTLISPSFAITATHALPGIGQAMRFYQTNSAASFVESTVLRTIPITQIGLGAVSDLSLIQFSSPTTGLAIYPVIAPPTPASLLGSEIFVMGRADTASPASMRLGKNVIDAYLPNFAGVNLGDTILFDYNTSTPDEALLVGGDSGGPSFVINAGTLALVGIHSFVYPDQPPFAGSGDTLVSSFITELNRAIAATGSLESVTAVPEPSSLVLLLGAAGLCYRQRHRAVA